MGANREIRLHDERVEIFELDAAATAICSSICTIGFSSHRYEEETHDNIESFPLNRPVLFGDPFTCGARSALYRWRIESDAGGLMSELAFPGMIMLLKLATKLFVGRSATAFDFFKAIVAFPVDVTFLALSFGAALLYATPPAQMQGGTLKLMFIFFGLCVLLAIFTTAICQKSDKSLDEWKLGWAVFYSVVTYAVSFAALVVSLSVPEIIK